MVEWGRETQAASMERVIGRRCHPKVELATIGSDQVPGAGRGAVSIFAVTTGESFDGARQKVCTG